MVVERRFHVIPEIPCIPDQVENDALSYKDFPQKLWCLRVFFFFSHKESGDLVLFNYSTVMKHFNTMRNEISLPCQQLGCHTDLNLKNGSHVHL